MNSKFPTDFVRALPPSTPAEIAADQAAQAIWSCVDLDHKGGEYWLLMARGMNKLVASVELVSAGVADPAQAADLAGRSLYETLAPWQRGSELEGLEPAALVAGLNILAETFRPCGALPLWFSEATGVYPLQEILDSIPPAEPCLGFPYDEE